ncbi:DUF5133 domain-containing protein [Streptomyces sp. NPDC003077]|uniref:DUF5133 domain-containing protein n=1 Tax=Streptomyces sp. NPDC003077 TaxID=3154443 RepID=UPI0033BF641D
MLMAHPAVLQDLVTRYEALEKQVMAGTTDAATRQRFQDVSYTLCVATGTRDVDAALLAAQYHLPGARVEDDSLLKEPAEAAGQVSGQVSGRVSTQASARTSTPASAQVSGRVPARS